MHHRIRPGMKGAASGATVEEQEAGPTSEFHYRLSPEAHPAFRDTEKESLMLNFIKTTILGGVVFLIPLIVFMFIVAQALTFLRKLTGPLLEKMLVNSVATTLLVDLAAILLLVMLCFAAGVLARTDLAGRAMSLLETGILEKIPAYSYIRSRAETVTAHQESALQPVLVRFDDAWQLAFAVDEIEGGHIGVYLPGAPDPWAGSVSIVAGDRVQRLDISPRTATQIFQSLGMGLGGELAGKDSLPKS